MSDEEIQKHFETDDFSVGSEADRVAYRAVFRAISKERLTKISDSFAERIITKVVAQKKREARRDFIWLSFGVVFLVVGLIVTATLAGLHFELGFLREMSAYTGVFVFGIAIIFGFSWIEKRMLSKTA
jgi:hypothetical protein